MKKFSFSLDKVLDYKTQIEENLRNEHAVTVKAVRDQEAQVHAIEAEQQEQILRFEEKKQHEAISPHDFRIYQAYFGNLSQALRREEDKLEELSRLEEAKRAEDIAAKQDRASIDMLKDKKRAEYNAAVQKDEELLIEEFVSNVSSRHA